MNNTYEDDINKLKSALRLRADLKKEYHHVELILNDSLTIDLFITKELWWIDDKKYYGIIARRFINAFKACKNISKFKELKLKIRKKNRRLNIEEILFNDIKLNDYHFKLY